MTLEQARAHAAAILAACEQSEAEGRDELMESDLDLFAEMDTAARDELAAAIERSNGG